MTMNATYSPEDNKLRLYSMSRLSRELYERVRAAGFKWAPKQELFVAPAWSPSREDLLVELCGEIGDEDYSPQERSADRVERFEDYRDKRANEAGASADAFESGPSAFGHQSRARAERQAARHDRKRVYAVSQWSKAEYWQSRTLAVISHALYKSSAAVRRSRILRLEAEQRKHEKTRSDYATRFGLWNKVLTMDGADTCVIPLEEKKSLGIDRTTSPACKLAYTLANGGCYGEFVHPRNPERKTSMYSLLTDCADPITAREAATLWLENASDPSGPDSNSARWSDHYTNRLAYEKAMLAEEGGSAADVEMEVGGWIGKHQIYGINRSSVTRKVVSVKLMGKDSGYTKESGYKVHATWDALKNYNIERLPEGAYRAPTAEERAAFAEVVKERKEEKKSSTPKAPTLMNPTDSDAERLQSVWNAENKAKHDKARAEHRTYGDFVPSAVIRMTQDKYSQLSKGSYAKCETRTLHAGGKLARRVTNMWSSDGAAYDKEIGAAQCKIRVAGYSPCSVIVITDKPQKPLPIEWVKAAKVAEVKEVETTTVAEVVEVGGGTVIQLELFA